MASLDSCIADAQRLYAELEIPRVPKCIRVYDLQPTPPGQAPNEHPDSVIRGTLRVVDLSKNPHFVALSYVWGESSRSRAIYCADQLMPVSDNCWEALWHLQHDPSGKDPGRNKDGSLTLWIDSICINQKDEEEKLHQVPLMREIYTMAASVCIWLGCGSDVTDEAMDYMSIAAWQNEFIVNEEGQLSRHHTWTNGPWSVALVFVFLITARQIMQFVRLKTSWAQSRDLWVRYGYPYTAASPFPEGVWEVLDRPWMKRIWTLQEAALAANPWILCGTRRLRWQSLLLSISHLDCLCRLKLIEENMTGGVLRTPTALRDICRQWSGLFSLWLHVNSHHQTHTHYPDTEANTMTQHQISDFYAFTKLHAEFIFRIYRRFKRMQTFVFVLIPCSIPCILYIIPAALAREILSPLAFLYALSWLVIIIRYFMHLSGDLMAVVDKPVYTSTFLLREMIRRRATDPRDKLYGIQGVMTQMDRKLEPSQSRMDNGLFFRDVFLCFLGWTMDLNLITYAQNSVTNQPSWVPNWNAEIDSYWLDIANGDFRNVIPEDRITNTHPRQVATSPGANMYSKLINCTPSSPGTFHLQHCHTLTVTGFKMGTLTATTGCLSPPIEPETRAASNDDPSVLLNMSKIQSVLTASRWVLGELTSMRPESRKYMFGESIDVFKHTLRERLVHSFRLSTTELNWPIETMALHHWARSLEECLSMSPLEAVAHLKKQERPWSTHLEICSQLSAKHRSLFSCEGESGCIGSGRANDDRVTYLGNGPVNAIVGDVCILVSGVSVPLLLRPREGAKDYSLVGAVFIADEKVMYGDLWKKLMRDHVREHREFRVI
ncbi:putative Heterokaryon incompatibility domain-containing protein [Seiridium cardinale]